MKNWSPQQSNQELSIKQRSSPRLCISTFTSPCLKLAYCNPSTMRAIQWKQIYCIAAVISEALRWTATCPKLTTNNSRFETGWFPWLGEVKHYLPQGPEAKCAISLLKSWQLLAQGLLNINRDMCSQRTRLLYSHTPALQSHACFVVKSILLYRMLS